MSKQTENQKRVTDYLNGLINQIQRGEYRNAPGMMFPHDRMTIESGFTVPKKKRRKKHFYLKKKQAKLIQEAIDETGREIVTSTRQRFHEIDCLLEGIIRYLDIYNSKAGDMIMNEVKDAYEKTNEAIRAGAINTRPPFVHSMTRSVPPEVRKIEIVAKGTKATEEEKHEEVPVAVIEYEKYLRLWNFVKSLHDSIIRVANSFPDDSEAKAVLLAIDFGECDGEPEPTL